MKALVNHFGDIATTGSSPCNSWFDAAMVTNFSQRLVYLLVYSFHPSIKSGLSRITSFDSWKDVIYIGFWSVAFDNLFSFFDNNHSCLLVIFGTVIDKHITFDLVPSEQTNIFSRYATFIATKQKQVKIEFSLKISNIRSKVSIWCITSGETPLSVVIRCLIFSLKDWKSFRFTLYTPCSLA